MKKELKEHQKIATRNIVLYAALAPLILAFVSYWGMGIHGYIPVIFLAFSFSNLLILYQFYKTENLIRVYFQGSTLIFVAIVLINVCSGGIDGVFSFFIPIMVLSGYSMRKKYGRFWLAMSILYLIVFYWIDGPLIREMNEVGPQARPFFIFLTLMTGTIILGAIYGEYLVELILHGKIKTKLLKAKNQENEILLKEIHHRVKNNMQVISGLLSLQSSFIDDPKIREYFKVSQDRIKTMGIVHEMLYEESDFTMINFHEYLKRLVGQLILSMKGNDHNIELEICVDDVSLNIDTAIPLGIIINEIVTNSLKHGITSSNEGKITIGIEKLNHPYFVLYIGDDGMGLPLEMDFAQSKSFGLNLIKSLSRQLNGEIEHDVDKKGLHFVVQFQEVTKRNIET